MRAQNDNAVLRSIYVRFLTICDILTNVKRNLHAVCEAFTRRNLLLADTIDNRETAVYAVAAAELGKFNHALEACLFKLRTADGLIFFVTRRVERNINEVDFVLQVGHDVALVDEVALTVGVEAGF